MKFISKSANYSLVIQPGIMSNPLAGVAAKAGIYARFRDGIFITEDSEVINRMQASEAFNRDFVAADSGSEVDPYADFREESEPAHNITEIKYGHIEGKMGSKRKIKIPLELKQAISEMVKEQAKAMATEMTKQLLPIALKQIKDKEAETVAKNPSAKTKGKIEPVDKGETIEE